MPKSSPSASSSASASSSSKASFLSPSSPLLPFLRIGTQDVFILVPMHLEWGKNVERLKKQVAAIVVRYHCLI